MGTKEDKELFREMLTEFTKKSDFEKGLIIGIILNTSNWNTSKQTS